MEELAKDLADAIDAVADARDALLAAIDEKTRENEILEVITLCEAAKAAHWQTKAALGAAWVRWLRTNVYGHQEVILDMGAEGTKTFFGATQKRERVKDRGSLAVALWDATVGQAVDDGANPREALRELADRCFGASWVRMGEAKAILAKAAADMAPDATEEDLAALIRSEVEAHIETEWPDRGKEQPADQALGVTHSRFVRRNPALTARSPEHKDAQASRSHRRSMALAAEAMGVHVSELAGGEVAA